MTAPPEPSPGEPPERARQLFGSRLALAVRYADLLAGDGVAHGHIGPREVPRLWPRHLVNCALLTDLLPVGADLVDVGSGAGLPAVPVAIRRPDLRVTAVEPMQRRSEFLRLVVAQLGLARLDVLRGRAEDAGVRDALGERDWVTARAVAPLERLVRWCLPLLRPGGQLLALKGRTATDEAAGAAQDIERLGGRLVSVAPLGDNEDETWVVTVERDRRRHARGPA